MKVKNVSGEDVVVPWLGSRLVLAGQVVDVPEGDVYAYTQTPLWEPADKGAESAHKAAHEDYERRAGFEPTPDEVPEAPGKNASREEWAAYVIGSGHATAEQIDGLGRDEIRDTYGNNDGSL